MRDLCSIVMRFKCKTVKSCKYRSSANEMSAAIGEAMTDIKIKDEYIKLEQALKLSGEFSMGSDAKYAVKEGKVLVNGAVEIQRGKKLRDGDIFSTGGHDYRIIGA